MIRSTELPNPESAELLQFTTPEAALGIKAVSYYVTSSLDTLDANEDVDGFHGIECTPEDATERLNNVARFVNSMRMLEEKLRNSYKVPTTAIELITLEVMSLGDSLFRLGNAALVHGLSALKTGSASFYAPDGKYRAQERIITTADSAYELFKALEPIAKSKANSSWMRWEEPPSMSVARKGNLLD
jgi:hypothetical protein